jgi:hypothetical protein
VVSVVALAALCASAPALAQGIIHQVTVKPRPSLPGKTWTFTSYYGCFEYGTGRPVNCSFTHTVDGVKPPASDPDNNGGHFHNTSRPLSLANKPLTHDGDTDPAPYGVAGVTATGTNGWGKVVHEMPEVSGNLAGTATMVLPRNWYCVSGCYTFNSWRYEDTYDIGIRNLAELPTLPPGGDYVKVRSPDTNHPDSVAFTGSAFTLQMLPLVAQNFQIISGRTLSVNDMSLVKGGLFDIGAQWTPPHKSHREGKDADINQGGVSCDQDRDLRAAADQLLSRVPSPGGAMRSALLCEPCSGGRLCRKHIDFE